MIRSVYNAGMGLLTLQKEQEAISNNLANARTPAYKESQIIKEASFSEVLANHTGQGGRQRTLGQMNLGTAVAGQDVNLKQGVLMESANPMDLALEGPGFFQLQTGGGVELSRNGRLHVDASGLLVDQGNRPVLAYDQSGALSELTLDRASDLEVDPSGRLQAADGQTYQLALVRLIDGDDLGALEDLGQGYYRAPEAALTPADDLMVRQGYYEGSNVDVVDQMVSLMENQRLTQMNGQIFNSLDQTLEKAVNEIGRV